MILCVLCRSVLLCATSHPWDSPDCRGICSARAQRSIHSTSDGRRARCCSASGAVAANRSHSNLFDRCDERRRLGVIERLKKAGFSESAGTTFDVFNAEGDVGTQMAAAVCSASPPYDLIVSLSTVATQTVLRANKRGLLHVFGLVVSPPGFGVPLGSWTEGSTRPTNVAGFGTLQPAKLLLMAMHTSASNGLRLESCRVKCGSFHQTWKMSPRLRQRPTY